MSGTGPEADPVAVATQHADLGLPVPRRTRLRFLKRLVARLGRLVIHHQVAYNHAMVDAVNRLRASVDDLRASADQLPASVDQLSAAQAAAETRIGNEIAALRSDLQTVHQAALESLSDRTRMEAQLGAVDLRSRQLGDEVELRSRQLEDAVELRAGQVEDHMTALAGANNEFRVQMEAVQRSAQTRHSLVDLFLRQLRREYPIKPDADRLVELPSGDDDFYEALEDTFRG